MNKLFETGKFIIYTDGGSRGNPGPSALGAVVGGREYGEYLGVMTNNQAEYRALVFALKKAKQLIGKKKAEEMEMEVRMDSEGLYRIDLQAAGIKLAPNPEYQWSISTLTGKESTAKDTVTGGRIRRVAAPPALVARLAGEAKANATQAFRDANLFYDALSELIPRLEAQPKDAALAKTHAELLAQFGIVLPNTMRIPDPAGRPPEGKPGEK